MQQARETRYAVNCSAFRLCIHMNTESIHSQCLLESYDGDMAPRTNDGRLLPSSRGSLNLMDMKLGISGGFIKL